MQCNVDMVRFLFDTSIAGGWQEHVRDQCADGGIGEHTEEEYFCTCD